ncbi:MAG: hypothetical protein EVA88_02730 [Rhodospirillaceae bacterium]|nr:MAG: hypothetical protein EVA88_02730 [Rhodospirillaceae bacterium]
MSPQLEIVAGDGDDYVDVGSNAASSFPNGGSNGSGRDVSVMSQGGSPETINITIEGSETVSDYDVSINASGELLIA